MATDPRYTESMGFIGWFITITAIGFFLVVFGTLFIIFLPFIIFIAVVVLLFCLYVQWDWDREVNQRK